MHRDPVETSAPREDYVPAGRARLFYRDVGRGQPAIVLHGGPDFSHTYLIPELDRLSDQLRLVYYDQRGRGRSGDGVSPNEVGIDSEIEDLETVRRHFGLERVAVLGHSWGGVLAMEYAVRHPDRVSHLVLMNSAPASHEDVVGFREARRRTEAAALEQMAAIAATAEYQSGDVMVEARYYRLHFRAALRNPDLLEEVVGRLRRDFTPEGILKARAIEDRLYEQTWSSKNYDLVPKLERLRVPALVLHGDHDLIPLSCAERIAGAIPGARLVVVKDCGHFAYLERPEDVHRAVADFVSGRPW